MNSVSEYSWLDRTIHRIAFSSFFVQMTAADLEKSIFGDRFRDILIKDPVFITSLPRAGTTLLLETFSQLPGFASHRYRDMPFVLAPILWDALSTNFRKASVLKERAHGDGMMVGYDSPEAFEEIIWRFFWPDKFSKDRISLWSDNEESRNFKEAFTQHMQKIVALRATHQGDAGRYVSKNNANIARIGLLKRMFPNCTILIPFRHPVDHAISLYRQHKNFLAQHDTDSFTKAYMEDIGHFEFGRLHRPIAFNGMREFVTQTSSDTLDYWLGYWIQAFSHIMSKADDIVLLSYERACKDGMKTLLAIGERINIPANQSMETVSKMFRAPSSSSASSQFKNKDLLDKALHVHQLLLDLSIV